MRLRYKNKTVENDLPDCFAEIELTFEQIECQKQSQHDSRKQNSTS